MAGLLSKPYRDNDKGNGKFLSIAAFGLFIFLFLFLFKPFGFYQLETIRQFFIAPGFGLITFFVLVVRKPVFAGLLKERKNGFVQLDWKGNLPGLISDTFDFDRDREDDFIITINSTEPETEIHPLDKKVENINVSTATSYEWAVRVNISR